MWKTSLYNTTKLTLELRDVLESGVDIWGDDSNVVWYEPDLTGLKPPYSAICTAAAPEHLKKKIEQHFYFRQIGCETLGRWLHMFRSHIAEIMPYYAQLYKSQELMFRLDDPFGNVDIVETFEQETTGDSSSTQSGTSSSEANINANASATNTKESSENREHRFSNTPQGSISNLDTHLTEASKDKNTSDESVTSSENTSSDSSSSATSSGNSSATSSGTVKHTLTRKGNQGVNTYAHDMGELRKTFINIEQMIIADLNHLFIGIY